MRKVVKKKAATKKVAKKKLTPRDYDKRYSAKKPGKRTSASGNTYYENRANRSDRGKLLGIGSVAIEKYKKLNDDINKVEKHITEYTKMSKDMGYNLDNRKAFKVASIRWKKYQNELKRQAKELKKYI